MEDNEGLLAAVERKAVVQDLKAEESVVAGFAGAPRRLVAADFDNIRLPFVSHTDLRAEHSDLHYL